MLDTAPPTEHMLTMGPTTPRVSSSSQAPTRATYEQDPYADLEDDTDGEIDDDEYKHRERN